MKISNLPLSKCTSFKNFSESTRYFWYHHILIKFDKDHIFWKNLCLFYPIAYFYCTLISPVQQIFEQKYLCCLLNHYLALLLRLSKLTCVINWKCLHIALFSIHQNPLFSIKFKCHMSKAYVTPSVNCKLVSKCFIFKCWKQPKTKKVKLFLLYR